MRAVFLVSLLVSATPVLAAPQHSEPAARREARGGSVDAHRRREGVSARRQEGRVESSPARRGRREGQRHAPDGEREGGACAESAASTKRSSRAGGGHGAHQPASERHDLVGACRGCPRSAQREERPPHSAGLAVVSGLADRTHRCGRRGRSARRGVLSDPRGRVGRQAGSARPLVSSPKGRISSPSRNAIEVNATGVPSVP